MDEQSERALFRTLGNIESDIKSMNERLYRWDERCDRRLENCTKTFDTYDGRLDKVEKGIDIKKLTTISSGIAVGIASAIAAAVAFFRGQ